MIAGRREPIASEADPVAHRDDEDDDDLPDGVYHDDELATVPCPYCRADVLEDADYCPRCRNYLSKEDAPAARKPTWIWVLLLVATAAMLVAAVR